MRIVSLLPSATEIVCDLGLGTELVGISHACDYPAAIKKLPKVTSCVIPKDAASAEIDRLVRRDLRCRQALYELDLELLRELGPDVIVSQALCDVCAVSADDVEAALCALEPSPRIVNLEPTCLEDVFATILEVGRATGVEARARERVRALRSRVATVAARTRQRSPVHTLFLEWLDPPYSAGHWNAELVRLAGGVDCLATGPEPSRRLGWDEIEAAAPDVLLVACCGYDEARAHRDLRTLAKESRWRRLACVRAGNVHVFDGNAYFSRPGPRLVAGLEDMERRLHMRSVA